MERCVSWKDVLANVGNLFNKPVFHASSEIATRKWDDKTESLGDWEKEDSFDETQEIHSKQGYITGQAPNLKTLPQ